MLRPFEDLKVLASVLLTELCGLLSVAHIGLYLTDDWTYDERWYTSLAGYGILWLCIAINVILFILIAMRGNATVSPSVGAD